MVSHTNLVLSRLAKLAHVDYAKKDRKEWVLQHAAQLVVMISQVHYFSKWNDWYNYDYDYVFFVEIPNIASYGNA